MTRHVCNLCGEHCGGCELPAHQCIWLLEHKHSMGFDDSGGPRQFPFAPLELAAFMAFIRGVDIPNTTEQARVALVERALRAEAERDELNKTLEAARSAVFILQKLIGPLE